MFCRECGTQNEDKAKFCRNCGLPIVPVEETIQPESVQNETPIVETPVQEAAEQETSADTTAQARQIVGDATQSQAQQAAEGSTQQQARQAAAGTQGQPGPGMPYGTPGPQAAYVAQGNQVNPTSAGAIVSLILGIVSVVCCCTIILGVGCGIAAICVAISDRKKNGSNGLTTAGLILGIVGISLAVIYLVWFVVSGEFGRLMEAIRTGRLQEYLNRFGEVKWKYSF